MRPRKLHRYSMIKRYGKIVDALVKYEFGHLADRMGIGSIRPLRSRIKKQEKVLKDTDSRTKESQVDAGRTWTHIHKARPDT